MAAFAAVIIGSTAADELAAGFEKVFGAAMAASPWFGLVFLIVLVVLGGGVVAVVVDEVLDFYKKWADRAKRSLQRQPE